MDYAQQQRNPARHMSAIAVVLLLHAVVVYALVTGLARKVVEVVKAPIETKIIEDVRKPPPPETPPPPPPKLEAPPPPFVPLPEIKIATPPPAPQQTITVTAAAKPPPPTPIPRPAVAKAPVRVAPVIEVGKRCAKPAYPPASLRAEEQGTSRLRFLVGVNGRVVKATVERSSGFARLDRAAVQALSECDFIPGTVDGKPEQSWATVEYVWKID